MDVKDEQFDKLLNRVSSLISLKLQKENFIEEYRAKKAQKEMGKKDLHTSEGVEIIIKVEYNLKGWIENFADYLRSAMSYCNVNNISDFQKFSQVIHISQLSRLAFKK